MISQTTINELRNIQMSLNEQAKKLVNEHGFITGDKYEYSSLINRAQEFKNCADYMEMLNNNEMVCK